MTKPSGNGARTSTAAGALAGSGSSTSRAPVALCSNSPSRYGTSYSRQRSARRSSSPALAAAISTCSPAASAPAHLGQKCRHLSVIARGRLHLQRLRLVVGALQRQPLERQAAAGVRAPRATLSSSSKRGCEPLPARRALPEQGFAQALASLRGSALDGLRLVEHDQQRPRAVRIACWAARRGSRACTFRHRGAQLVRGRIAGRRGPASGNSVSGGSTTRLTGPVERCVSGSNSRSDSTVSPSSSMRTGRGASGGKRRGFRRAPRTARASPPIPCACIRAAQVREHLFEGDLLVARQRRDNCFVKSAAGQNSAGWPRPAPRPPRLAR